MPLFRTSLFRVPAVIGLLAILFFAPACNRKAKHEPLIPIPAKYLDGNQYWNRSKGYRFPLPSLQWEYLKTRKFDVAFNARNSSIMLVVDGYTDWVGLPSYHEMAERMIGPLRGRLATVETETSAPEGLSRVVLWDKKVEETPALTRFNFEFKADRKFKIWLPRTAELYTQRKGHKLYAFLYFAEKDDFSGRYDEFLALVEKMELGKK